MAFYDMPLEELQTYQPPRSEPKDFDAFWERTLTQARSAAVSATFTPVDYGLTLVESYDVTFSGYCGQPIKAWLTLPAKREGRLPCVVEFIGYGGGRAFPTDWLLWANAGYAHFVMDTRGQGGAWSPGDTPDIESDGSNGQYPGFMTRGVLSPDTYYYRRVFTDAVRALETVAAHPAVDPDRIAVTGGSQGGGITLAMSGLSPLPKVIMPDVPFLCHYRRATTITDGYPYQEITRYLLVNRDKVNRVFETLSYFDGVNFATRAKASALFSVGLMDEICPPSTVFAAYNYYGGPKDIRVWEFNHHEGGGTYQSVEKIRFLKNIWK